MKKICIYIVCALLIVIGYFIFSVYSTLSDIEKEQSEQCDLNQGIGCSYVGWIYFFKGRLISEDNYSKAKYYLEKGCNLNDALGCGGLSILYEYGLGVEQDAMKAQKYMDIVCNLPNKEVCDKFKQHKK